MGTQERREREKAELRQKILEAARTLFVAEGSEAVTMRKIAASIEYSATAIYAYFPDKEALLAALCEHDFSQFLNIGMHVMQVPDPVERILRGVQVYIDFAIDHPHQYQFMFMMRNGVQPSDSALVSYALIRDTFSQILEAGRFHSEWTDVDLITQVLWSAVHGAAALHIAGRDEHQFARPMRDVATAAVRSMFAGMLRDGLPAAGAPALAPVPSKRAPSKRQPEAAARGKKRKATRKRRL